jgi:hypothetical protein
LPILQIPFHRIVIDVLHLFLRITDVLYVLFVSDLRELDGKQKNQVDLSTQPHLRQFFADLTAIYQIRRPFYVNGKELKLRDLQGPEKKKLFSNVDLKVYSPENQKLRMVNKLWIDFMTIFNKIKGNDANKDIIKNSTKQWLLSFSELYRASHITPYMHCFGNHIHEFIDLYGGVNQFNLEGLEKLNHLTHSHVFRSTNMHSDYLTQVLKKRNRLEVTCRD